MPVAVSRRAFIECMLALPVFARTALAATGTVRIGVLHESFATDALQGARMSAAEAERAAALLGRELEILEHNVEVDALDLAHWSEQKGAAVVVLACRPAAVDRLLSSPANVLILNALAAPDALRGPCPAGLFHIATTLQQQKSALQEPGVTLITGTLAERLERLQSLTAVEKAGPIAEITDDSTYVVAAADVPIRRCSLWHAELGRFGAEQLNARYYQAYAAGMSAAAWAGWFAVKCAWETAARAQTAAAMLALLADRPPVFDGHKGSALRFARERILDQPLYLTETRGPDTVVSGQWHEPVEHERICP